MTGEQRSSESYAAASFEGTSAMSPELNSQTWSRDLC